MVRRERGPEVARAYEERARAKRERRRERDLYSGRVAQDAARWERQVAARKGR